MKFILAFLCCTLMYAQDVSMSTLRAHYKEAVTDAHQIVVLEQYMEGVNTESSPKLLAYKGALLALKAKEEKKIKLKKELFLQAKSAIELAVSKDTRDIELRFIRLGIQERIPKFLKYKHHISEDRTFILNHIKSVRSSNLKKHLKAFVAQSKSFNAEEKNKIANY